MGTYFRDLSDAFVSTLKGMSVTLKHLFSKPVTVHYPDEHMPISDAYLGKHELDQAGCIACSQCVKMCPVECLTLDVTRHPGKVLEWKKFTVNYNRCIFCGLCQETCPTNVLHMTKEYDLSVEDRSLCEVDLLKYKGLRPEDHETIEKAKIAQAEKKKAAAEAKAKKAAEAKKSAGEDKGAAGSAGEDKGAAGSAGDDKSAADKADNKKADKPSAQKGKKEDAPPEKEDK